MTAGQAAMPLVRASRFDRFAGDFLVSVAYVVATYAVSLGLYYGLHVERLHAFFLLPVLAAAVTFGSGYGFVAAFGCVSLLGPYMPLTPGPLQIARPQGASLLLVYLTAALAAGLYARTIRLRRAAGEAGDVADRAAMAHAAGPAGEPPAAVQARGAEPGRPGVKAKLGEGLVAAAASICLAATGGAASHLLGGTWSQHLLPILLMASVLAAGGTYGAAAGMLAAAAAALIQSGGAAVDRFDPIGVTAAFLLFGSAGCAVGVFASRIRRERQALQRVFLAGDALSQAKVESDIWRTVVDAAAEIAGGPVQLADEDGRSLHVGGDARPPAEPAGPLRVQRLTVDDRRLGALTWRANHKGPEDQRAVDQAVSVLAGLGASAVTRSRLGVEKAEMELVARTETLRTILLDAVSHHFRTPLSSIMGSVTNLLEQADQHDVRANHEFLLIIKEQANRLDRYVDNFLGVARLESGSIEINPRAMDLEALVNDVWESFGESGGARRFLDVQIDDREIWADPGPLKQVLGNILENAVKFSREETIVSVIGRVEGDRMILEVTDEGSGVPPADLPRIFGRFYRSREAKASGLGLGLYITKSLVDLMGGVIEAWNRSDGKSGLTMRVALPLTDA
ncbi:sensor histidine kinase [Phenylobacterium sp.]|jgi:two-component system sensor histidine kinase KdpD|uniref:sensor histidine kinase n=1 Tax=Phenylobacterium sp. TaxID=1871053 RepID=UPI002F425A4F